MDMKRLVSVSMALIVGVCVGCGGGGDEGKIPVFPASGTVTMSGAPLADATVAFSPQGDQPTAIGTTDADGKFQLTTYEFGDGAADGKYKVVITKAEATSSSGGSEHGESYKGGGEHSKAATTKSVVPEQYSSSTDTPLSVEVVADGENVFDLKIE